MSKISSHKHNILIQPNVTDNSMYVEYHNTIMHKLNINTCSQYDIMSLKVGLGPVLSLRIIENRPYTELDSIRKNRGFGEIRTGIVKKYFYI